MDIISAKDRVDERGRQACGASPRGFLEPDDRQNVVKTRFFCGVMRSLRREIQMDTTTLLIIVLLILLLGGGGWYGRGRWY
ncbi:hypothetical protein [Bradyrhizobium elkanii]|uniref:hypothetical protein n=1 Tax=Bradyrhizobium elkanii TaxID=29448 RepID=UPI003D19C638